LKKILLLLPVLLIPVSFIFADIEADRVIDNVQNWTPKEGPYIISDDVVIEKKGFVTIQPGTVVKFREGAKITVKGALYSKGSPKNPVRMLPYDGESFYGGIRFESAYKNTVEFTIMIRGALISEGTPVVINNNYILNSTGIEIFHFGTAVIKNNYFYNNTYGVYIEGKNIRYNISNNTFNRCRYAVFVKELVNGAGKVNGNNFFSSEINVTNYTPADLDFKNNFWGLTSEARIQGSIYDKKNNNKAGRVIFRPYEKRKLSLFEPPPAYISLVKIYLKLKRPDEEPTRVGIGAGLTELIILTPEDINKMGGVGYGISGEATFNITGAFLLGVEGRLTGMENSDKTLFEYSLSMARLMLNFQAYIGWQKRAFLLPYVKIGNGITILSEVYQSEEKIFDGRETKKHNEICYSLQAGLGGEWFLSTSFSLKAEAMYNYTFSERGNISFPSATVSGNVYFDAPFYLNTTGAGSL